MTGTEPYQYCEKLIFKSEGKTGCIVYEHRLGSKTHQGTHRCAMRKYTAHDFPNCPYNTGKPMHPFFKGKV